MKKIDEGGYVEFLYGYFPKNFPALRAKFPAEIEWSMIEVPYGVRKPLDMSVQDFDEFRRIELEWLIENGFVPKDERKPLFRVVIDGNVSIEFSTIRNIIKLTENTTTIVVRNSNGQENSYDVVGDINYVNNKFGIASVHK